MVPDKDLVSLISFYLQSEDKAPLSPKASGPSKTGCGPGVSDKGPIPLNHLPLSTCL